MLVKLTSGFSVQTSDIRHFWHSHLARARSRENFLSLETLRCLAWLARLPDNPEEFIPDEHKFVRPSFLLFAATVVVVVVVVVVVDDVVVICCCSRFNPLCTL